MKLYLSVLITLYTCALFAQQDPVSELPSSSFAENYKVTMPALQYSYDQDSQIHNYSGNWDFDNDGINDELYFVGTGGAHLYFYLRLVLTGDKIVRNYESVLCDAPYLSNVAALKNGESPVCFIISDFDKDGIDEIFIRLDTTTSISDSLRKNGVTSKEFLVKYHIGKIRFENFRPGKK